MKHIKAPAEYDKTIKTHGAFLNWLQEYSKVIVSITFFIFVIVNFYLLVMFAIEYFTSGNMEDLSVLLSETHTTFREVIGGYIIKAAVENSLKIGGSVITRYIDYKYPRGTEDEKDEEEIYTNPRGEDG